MKELIISSALPYIGTALGVLVLWLVKKGLDWLGTKTKLANWAQVSAIVQAVVKRLNQTVVDGLRVDLADGKITKEEFGARAKATAGDALQIVKQIAGEVKISLPEEGVVITMVEAAVADEKKAQAVATAVGAAKN